MSAATLAEILTYPIKSTFASSVSESEVGPRGIRFDRHWALFSPDGDLITARDYPALLKLSTQAGSDALEVYLDGSKALTMSYSHHGSPSAVDVWGVQGTGVRMNDFVNEWFSQYLGTPCEVMFMSEGSSRGVRPDSGGKQGDVVSYADDCPVMLVSVDTLDELNARLASPVTIRQFRPNLVVSGCGPSAEDGWKRIQIGEVELEITKKCKRCVFATIDPESRTAHEEQEPLRTLSTYRRHPEGGVAFGMLSIPRSFGRISVGDEVRVLE